jgi:two-component sensor histidine kinase
MSIDIAIPCGLIINELVSNSLKYAFPEGRGGEVYIRFAQESEQALRLIVRDNGIGCPPGFNLEETTSLGLQLVQSLITQLGGSFRHRTDTGVEFDISFTKARA